MPQPDKRPLEQESPALAQQFQKTRRLTQALLEPLSEADALLQSMDDASPAKWHGAHTTWFWETFLLRDRKPGYRLFDDTFAFLFNSYYEAEGKRLARGQRGMISRPTLAQVLDWRAHVDEAMLDLLDDPRHAPLIALGIAHEQQHIELLLTDIKHAFHQNPTGPAMWEGAAAPAVRGPEGWIKHPGGIAKVGHQDDDFAFDNEGPAHRTLLEPFALSRRLVTNARMGGFHCRWRLRQACAVAFGRMGMGSAMQDRRAVILARRATLYASRLATARP